jgi:hypothetical protein
MKTSPKPSKAREILWISMTVLTLFIAVQQTIKIGISESLILWAFVIVSVIMYLLRRNLRKKEEKEL